MKNQNNNRIQFPVVVFEYLRAFFVLVGFFFLLVKIVTMQKFLYLREKV